MKILLLGGTAEARRLAAELRDTDVLYSLAGATENPADVAVPSRVGGFGGVEGLVQFLREYGFTHIVDATHPFAARMQANASAAASQTRLAAIHLIRPSWRSQGAEAESAVDLASAAAMLRADSTVFLALGGRRLDPFRQRRDLRFVVRGIDRQPDHDNFRHVSGTPPYSVQDETATLRDCKVDTMVMRDSGGAAGLSKLVAAQRLGLRVVMVDRPLPPDGLLVETVEQVLIWLGKEEAKWSAAS